MEKLTRWQSLVAFVAGAGAAVSPIWIATSDTATGTMVILGGLTAAVALWSLATSGDRISEYALVLMGALFIASPWVMGFVDLENLALTAWIAGAVTVVTGLLGMPEVEERMHHRPIAH